MKVILQKAVPKLGKKDDVIDVAEGYARNALFPRNLAIIATPEALNALSRRQQQVAAEKSLRHKLLDQAIKAVEGTHVVLKAKGNAQGGLFSKIDTEDIAHVLEEYRIPVDVSCISIVGGPIKKFGTYTIQVREGTYTSSFLLDVVDEKNLS